MVVSPDRRTLLVKLPKSSIFLVSSSKQDRCKQHGQVDEQQRHYRVGIEGQGDTQASVLHSSSSWGSAGKESGVHNVHLRSVPSLQAVNVFYVAG